MPIHDLQTLKYEQTMNTVIQLLDENKIPAIVLTLDPRGEVATGWTSQPVSVLQQLLRTAFEDLIVQFYSMTMAAARGNPKVPEIIVPDGEITIPFKK